MGPSGSHTRPPQITGNALGGIEHFLPEEPAEGIGEGADGDTLKNPPGFRAAFFEEKPESELWSFQEHHEGFFPH
jgi:hypothetical protein